MRSEMNSIATFVGLPKTWIESCNLKKGDRSSVVVQKDGTLETQSQKSPEPEEGGIR